MIVQSGLDGWLMELSVLIIGLITGFYFYSVYCYNYWKRKGIPYIEGKLPFGTIGDVILSKISLGDYYINMYNNNKGKKYFGYYAFFQPQLLVRDLDLIKNILMKDSNIFLNRGVHFHEKSDPLSAHLFALEGMRWKNLRAKLSPAFTSGKMKMMFNTMKTNADEMVEFGLSVAKKDGVIDFKDLSVRYGLDVITNVTLGLKGNNLVDDNTDLRRIVDMVLAPSINQSLRTFFTLFCKNFAKLVRLRFTPIPVQKFFIDVVQQNIDYRKKNNAERNDFMQLLINIKSDGLDQNGKLDEKDTNGHLTVEEMAAQAFIFVLAGYEPPSVALCFCMYELALNKDVQNKLIQEIDAVDGNITYEILNQLPYLDMVLCETLRKYPPNHSLQRENNREYVLPGGEILEKGTSVIISVIGLHRDPDLFPDPEKFDPERFSKGNIDKILPGSYLPFGDGPRYCIGTRFAKMQAKLAIYAFLSRFSLDICEKTPIPLKFHKHTFNINSDGGMFLRVTERFK